MIIRTHAYARAGLIGNPSDGFYGKTISFIIKNFKAHVVLFESPDLVLEPSNEDQSRWNSMKGLVRDVKSHGYYGGLRLIKGAIKRFSDYCDENGVELAHKNFTIHYSTTIPRLVGMAGSSAIVTATMRALMAFYGVDVAKPALANLILSVEKDELGIGAGLQDRVIQVYEGMVYMDFSRDIMEAQGHGRYEPLDPKTLPPLYIAYDAARSESSEMVHNPVRTLFERGDTRVVEAMKGFAALTDEVKSLLLAGRGHEIGPVLNRNFDLRSTIYTIAEGNRLMVMTARSVGASAKFAGSGGAIVGTYANEAMYGALEREMSRIGCVVFKPEIV